MMARAWAAAEGERPRIASARGPLVSVVIPFLDPPEAFFREAVSSVLAQSYRPLELILVNDGSGPAAVRTARELVASVGVPARLLEHPGGVNRGSSATRNLGASAAAGEYLAFLDADDAWVPSKLTRQVQILQKDPAVALVFGPSRYWYSWAGNDRELPKDFVPNRGVRRFRVMAPPQFVALFLRGRIINPTPTNFLVRHDAYLACGGFEETFRGMYEDQAFMVKLGLGYRVVAVPECWDWYRQHQDSMTARARDLGAEQNARRIFLAWVRDYCAGRSVTASEVWEAVNKEVWLVGPASRSPRKQMSQASRRLRKWWLKAEESLLPASLRQRIWGRF